MLIIRLNIVYTREAEDKTGKPGDTVFPGLRSHMEHVSRELYPASCSPCKKK